MEWHWSLYRKEAPAALLDPLPALERDFDRLHYELGNSKTQSATRTAT